MVSVTKASRIEAILYIASHEGMPKAGDRIRHAQGEPAHWSEVKSVVTEDCLRTAQAVIDGKIKLPPTAAAGRSACIVGDSGIRTTTASILETDHVCVRTVVPQSNLPELDSTSPVGAGKVLFVCDQSTADAFFEARRGPNGERPVNVATVPMSSLSPSAQDRVRRVAAQRGQDWLNMEASA